MFVELLHDKYVEKYLRGHELSVWSSLMYAIALGFYRSLFNVSYNGLLLWICDNWEYGLNGLFWCCRGYKRFFKRTALETSDYLKDDCLSVNCIVGVVKSHTEGPKIYSIAVPPSNIGQHFGQLLESGKGTDVNFEVDGENFSAHKLVLAARSPVFRAQLFGPMKDQNTQCIKIEDMEAPVFKVCHKFLTWFAVCIIWSLNKYFLFLSFLLYGWWELIAMVINCSY